MKKSFDELDPDEYQMVEGEERRFLDPRSQKVNSILEIESKRKLKHTFGFP